MVHDHPVEKYRLKGPNGESLPVTLQFNGWLTQLIKRVDHDKGLLTFPLTRRTSIKDLIESFGVPHTEVGSIRINGKSVIFDHLVTKKSSVEISPLYPPVDVLAPGLLRPFPLPAIRFLVDANVGKLARKLRMAGFDTLYNVEWSDSDLANISAERKCVLLTRDIMLLKRKKIIFGHFVREILPTKQLAELMHFYGLSDKMNVFSRCIRCNGLLVPVDKQEILNQIEPLTQKYYNSFHRCSSCSHVYWSGSHRSPMEKDIKKLSEYRPLSY